MASDRDRVIRLKTSALVDLVLVPRDLAHDWALGQPVPAYYFTRYTDRWFQRDNRLLRQFMQLNQISTDGADQDVQNSLDQAIFERRVLVYQVQRRAVIVPVEGVEPIGPSDDDDPADPLTWIAFEVTDAVGQPVAGKSFTLTLPDGSTRDGTLDENGKARLNRIPPGSCKFSLTDPDNREVAYSGAA